MPLDLLDEILEHAGDRILAVKRLRADEPYLGDHFPSYPIMPGVLMLETMVQAARRLLEDRCDETLVLGAVTALKYGAMVRPGESLEVEITLAGEADGDGWPCRGTGRVRHADGTEKTAVSGRFTMRPVRAD